MLISWTTIVGLLRKKIVLGIIFGLSLTYFAISLFAHDKISTTLSTYVDDADESMIIDGDDVPIDDDIDDFSLKLSDADDVNISLNNLQDFGNINSTNTSRSCRNSIQGKVLIVDERGFVCARKEVLPSGCCSLDIVNDQNNDNFNLSKRERYSCDTCTSQGCCAIYEFCVSCCLHPGKKRIKKESHLPQNRRDIQQKYRKIDDTIKQRLRKLDKFQQCLAICRTSSASVRHENTYKNPNLKYCFTNHVIIGNQRSISDSNNNNNGDNVAITSSN
ncbi:hypothetical protein HCN44_009060 [Aphidius gifuensis]|uniref:SREBP regulating gene protein n=2 Tax=Aphidius gifuensis TaxID=684658 RepID=A0A834Y3E2_APHGI|nr:hypothetical protein HCN44_009060 [Aphidius gifuensis]